MSSTGGPGRGSGARCLEVLEGPGAPASSIVGPATEALRAYLAGPQAVDAPSDGWRAIAETPDEVIFAAPPDGGYSDWWVTRFTMNEGEWKSRETELVDSTARRRSSGMGSDSSGQTRWCFGADGGPPR
jgi:hypothetical protein